MYEKPRDIDEFFRLFQELEERRMQEIRTLNATVATEGAAHQIWAAEAAATQDRFLSAIVVLGDENTKMRRRQAEIEALLVQFIARLEALENGGRPEDAK
jgi:hypothetical protein